YDFHVEKGQGGDPDGNAIYASSQEGIKYLGSDIRHIMVGNPRLAKVNTFFFGSSLYWVIILLIIIAFVAMLLISKQRADLRKDEMKTRNKKATKVAKGRLKNAYNYLKSGEQNKFYEELSQALWGYIADKLSIERAKLSMDTVNEAMNEKNVPEDLTKQFVDTLNNCEFARFAPGDAGKKMEDLYQQGIEVISKAERVL
ncbi:MAG: BatD family protein, partial [Bacteroidales bacterium]|nr:BatD family protein [Bacteroidales bacterium]